MPVALVLAVLGGICAVLAFPPYDQWYLLPVGLGLLSPALLVRSWAGGALVGLAWGIAFFLPLTAWAKIYAGIEPWVALAVFESLFAVAYALLARTVLVRRGLGVGSMLVIACLWAGTEALRSHVPWGGLPWGASAFALQHSPLLNLGPWIGTAGLAAVVCLLGQLGAAGALRLLGRAGVRRSRASGLGLAALAAVLVLACVVVPYPANPPSEGRSSMAIAGIQGNVPPIDPETLAMPVEIFGNSLAGTADAARAARTQGRPLDLVVWPEDSAGWDAGGDPWTGGQLTLAAQDAGAPILVGTQGPAPGGERYNTALLWMPDGTIPQSYAKRHPVPFGEYIPARDLFRRLSDKVDLVGMDMAPGTEVGVLDVGGRRVGVLICFEIAYENLVQDTVGSGAQVIVVQSNNALFGTSHEAVQQLAEARVMSVISGRSIVHVSTVGTSAIVTPDGRTLAEAAHWTSGVVAADVPLYSGTTPAMAAGGWIAVVLGALGFAGWCAAQTSRERALAPAPTRSERRTR